MKALLLAAAILAAAPAFAQDTAGRNLAAGCAICHGTDGRPVTQDVAALAGQPKEKIVGDMRAFRDGKRTATVMHQIAKGYTDAQIETIAAWYAARGKHK
jgi:sulfide dehydrogenase cytochrome subunit